MIKVEMLYPRGYCAGVKNAINVAINARNQYPDKNVYIVGYLVHNKEVIKNLENLSIETLYSENGNYENLITSLVKGSVLIFPAHGHDERLDSVAEKNDLIVLDAVCPKVKQNNKIIKDCILNSHQVIYIGISNHPETNASISIDENVLLYDINKDFDYSLIYDETPLVINQTTLNYNELMNIHSKIKSKIPNARFQNEICNSTRMRQQSIHDLPQDVDLILIVGDIASSNTNRLLEVAQSSHPKSTCMLVNNVGQINKEIVANKNHIVISSGASTPSETINMIYEYVVNCFSK